MSCNLLHTAHAPPGRRGGALVMVAFCTVMLAGLSFSLLAVRASGASQLRGPRGKIGRCSCRESVVMFGVAGLLRYTLT